MRTRLHERDRCEMPSVEVETWRAPLFELATELSVLTTCFPCIQTHRSDVILDIDELRQDDSNHVDNTANESKGTWAAGADVHRRGRHECWGYTFIQARQVPVILHRKQRTRAR